MEKIFFPDKEIKTDIIELGNIFRKIRAHDSKMMMVEVFFETGAKAPEHKHFHEQITYCIEGEFDFCVEGVSHRMKSGDSIYIQSNKLHYVVCHAKGRLLDAFTPQREDFLS